MDRPYLKIGPKPEVEIPYLVRLIKPKRDRISRLARSTKLSKILAGHPPGRNPWDRVSGLAPGVSSNLMRFAEIRFSKEFDPVETSLQLLHVSLAPDFGAKCGHLRGIRRFCANLLKVLKHPRRVKLENPVET